MIRAGVGLGVGLRYTGSDPRWGWFRSGTETIGCSGTLSKGSALASNVVWSNILCQLFGNTCMNFSNHLKYLAGKVSEQYESHYASIAMGCHDNAGKQGSCNTKLLQDLHAMYNKPYHDLVYYTPSNKLCISDTALCVCYIGSPYPVFSVLSFKIHTGVAPRIHTNNYQW